MRVTVCLVFQIVEAGWNPWSDFNADNNRRDFYCENTCLATRPEVTFWPVDNDIWPLHIDSGLWTNEKVLKDGLAFEKYAIGWFWD